MTKRQLKLGLVLTGAGGPGNHNLWLDPAVPADASVDIEWYIAHAQKAEAAKFDLVFIVDSQFITPDSPPHYLSRLEPLTLLSGVATRTNSIGLVGTLTTSYNSPYNVARRFGSLDHISGGRAGWNVVTSGDAGTAGNYGRDEHYDYDTRYGRASEHVKVVQALWDSYETDALPRDRGTGQFLDPGKLHALNHRGEHFSVAGPLNLERPPQGHPVVFQAGDSTQGRDLGAEVGEGIFTHAATLTQAKAFYDDIKGRAVRTFGRRPEGLVILPGVGVIVGDTDEEARELERHYRSTDHSFDQALAEFGRSFGWHDFRQYDLDAPFPQETLVFAENSFRTGAQRIAALAAEQRLTLRQVVQNSLQRAPGAFVGTAETVADRLQEWFEAYGVDGYNIHAAHPAQLDRFIDEVVPILVDRGVFRSEYESDTLRGNLGLPVPGNRYEARADAAVPVGV
ncbi:LLM class flavin-dependent oxidoreductase [Microbacterium sp. CFBP9034]|uniref:LLM class flavin-dependent oxidoreductase n=1 Tax=Microbacterium sp. CFBP9034 TaxID=3096540 RepID=UPI002A6A8460|nr:LLM class flavin-dependent oxidoreductase [Microbacterium sp. CFBP9034]MDY0910198.1 LLM class flavin-dependent oxidoreductase [Microbacterium sp. CFBP9034]